MPIPGALEEDRDSLARAQRRDVLPDHGHLRSLELRDPGRVPERGAVVVRETDEGAAQTARPRPDRGNQEAAPGGRTAYRQQHENRRDTRHAHGAHVPSSIRRRGVWRVRQTGRCSKNTRLAHPRAKPCRVFITEWSERQGLCGGSGGVRGSWHASHVFTVRRSLTTRCPTSPWHSTQATGPRCTA